MTPFWSNLWRRLRHRLTPADPTGLRAPLHARRMVVLDVETTGIQPNRDQIISIGAVVIQDLSIDCTTCFDVILRQEQPSSRENILFHGIGAEAQLGGLPPAEGLTALLAFIGQDPLVAFHADFDQFMIAKALREHLQTRIANPWLDLSRMAVALFPDKATRLRSLDEWSRFFAVPIYQRHHALEDAFTAAQIGLILIKAAMGQGNRSFADLLALDRDQRWLSVRA